MISSAVRLWSAVSERSINGMERYMYVIRNQLIAFNVCVRCHVEWTRSIRQKIFLFWAVEKYVLYKPMS